MKNYIVPNCPAIAADNNNNPFCFNVNLNNKEQKLCKDCTDCVIKQIVDKCKDIKKDHYWGMREIRFSQEILQLLEIEEVDE